MNFSYTIRLATQKDEEDLKQVLIRNGQKPTIVINDRSVYFMAEAGEIIGLAGAEISGDSALIRSTAVLSPYRGKGIAKKMIECLLEGLKERGIRRLYLFSRDTGGFWGRFGFVSCEVEEIIGQLPDAPQVIYYMKDNTIWTDVAWFRSMN